MSPDTASRFGRSRSEERRQAILEAASELILEERLALPPGIRIDGIFGTLCSSTNSFGSSARRPERRHERARADHRRDGRAWPRTAARLASEVTRSFSTVAEQTRWRRSPPNWPRYQARPTLRHVPCSLTSPGSSR